MEQGLNEAPWGAVIDILDAGVRMAQACVAKPVGQSPVVAFRLFSIEQHFQPFSMTEFAGLGDLT